MAATPDRKLATCHAVSDVSLMAAPPVEKRIAAAASNSRLRTGGVSIKKKNSGWEEMNRERAVFATVGEFSLPNSKRLLGQFHVRRDDMRRRRSRTEIPYNTVGSGWRPKRHIRVSVKIWRAFSIKLWTNKKPLSSGAGERAMSLSCPPGSSQGSSRPLTCSDRHETPDVC